MTSQISPISQLPLTLSFDIGLKNLAYCIMDLNNNKPIIYKWDIIDLVSNPNGIVESRCCELIKSGKNKGSICNKSTLGHWLLENGKFIPQCSRHKQKQMSNAQWIEQEDFNKLSCQMEKSKSKSKSKSNLKCGNKAHFYYVDNLTGKITGCCKMHSKMKSDSSLKRWVTSQNISSTEMRICLFNKLDNLFSGYNFKHILVEHQPSKARERIKEVANAIFDYFIMSHELYNCYQSLENLREVDAKNKLTVYEGSPISCKLKGQYARNKFYAGVYCSKIISSQSDQSDWLKYFESHKKKDDLADCFLQGLWYLKYGRYGKKNILKTEHQQLVYFQNNVQKYKKVRPYKPNKKSLERGRLTLSQIKYQILKNSKNGIGTLIKRDSVLKNSIIFYFKDIDKFLQSI